jgi:Na+-transporting NADH:ubiquinone oxidoreductase subunit NqrB
MLLFFGVTGGLVQRLPIADNAPNSLFGEPDPTTSPSAATGLTAALFWGRIFACLGVSTVWMVLLGAVWLYCAGRGPPRHEYEEISDTSMSGRSAPANR